MANNNNNEENNSIHYHQEPQWLTKYAKHQGDWLEKTKGNLMIVATVIASVTFQVMVNPPGGVWQEDNKCSAQNQTGLESVCREKAGTSVLEHYDPKRIQYIVMVISSTVSFSASMSFILLVILGFRLRNRLIMVILVIFMAVAVICMAVAFILAVTLVHINDHTISDIVVYYAFFWVAFPILILFLLLISLFLKLLVWVIRKTCCGRSRRSRSRLPTVISTTHPVPDHSGP